MEKAKPLEEAKWLDWPEMYYREAGKGAKYKIGNMAKAVKLAR